ncbi:hypothetical protein EXA23_02780 [Vibrio cincinnatiensis]|uniref:Uncharacterized protein n=1 Tax=Vibrio cincinnatiensis DSM 19608 TaxID=1123491 RepID=A0A1T4Q7G6_VIBCI|nr:hypothetical protein [Vibrio cincinnatiensis]MCG3723266.1 hypothetical protein [Vibrio cincinnatiensis]MCG3734272.1 hypothetical protein [Vibrio cincinnatiensis]MCG3737075.1 hypothetical protein [Vibrio cincinnatiensis]MCG3741410.1 hypothetical protein [Vibrio cincinnatiensis]MCG3744718.1 hypothetical protein [Vibrio cincinnatiensis]
MAVVPKHTDSYSHYDPDKDLTIDQLHRFTQAANSAQKKREEQLALETPVEEKPSMMAAVRRARRRAMKPIVTVKPDKPNTLRYIIWLIVFALIALWLMYISG